MKRFFLICCMILIVTGCGYLEPSEVNEAYVKNAFEKSLRRLYDSTFVVDIIEFNETSENKEAKAIAYPVNDPSLTFEISGYIEDDCVSNDSCYGTSYHTKDNFHEILLDLVYEKLGKKYSIQIGENADMKLAAKNFELYFNDFRKMIDDYAGGVYFNGTFGEPFLNGYIPITLNEQEKWYHLVIDQSKNKVTVDYLAGYPGSLGEIEIEEYLQLIVDGGLCLKKCEVQCERYSKVNCDCSECS